MFAKWLEKTMEMVLLTMVAAAPWLFGSVHSLGEFVLSVGIFLVSIIWIARIVVERSPLWKPCSILVGLALLCLLGIAQIIPLPATILGFVSPETVRLRAKLLPDVPEKLGNQNASIDYPPPPTLSLAPSATRTELIRLIAVLLLFTAIRANLRNPATLHRLALVMVANGFFLSLLGLAQHFTSPQNVVFWTFESEGTVFGPFICRNHFAYFINLSIGLGVGLLLSTRHFLEYSGKTTKAFSALPGMLQDARVLWIGSALVIMGAALCCSMSRGGFVAFVAGAVLCVALHLRYVGRYAQWLSGFLFILLGVTLTAWLGAGMVGPRLATLWQTNVLEESRGPVWGRVLALFGNFPLMGTGLGTFPFVEPLTRGPTDSSNIVHEHMHNDYLEALIEGGICELAIILGVLFLVFRAGFRAYHNHRGTKSGAMAIGALFGITAIAVQSTVDFGLHIPAVTLLTLTICACLANLEEWSSVGSQETTGIGSVTRNPWLAAVQVVAVSCVAVFLLDQCWRAELAERYRLAANASPINRADKKIAYLESALAYATENALLHVAVGDAYRLSPEDGSITRAFAHFFQARTLNPCLVQPHLFMAANAKDLKQADLEDNYLARACFLDPSNSKTWYVTGLRAWQNNQLEHCWECWKRSLQINSTHLNEILVKSSNKLAADALPDRVLPADPQVLYEAYVQLSKMAPRRNVDVSCLNRALEILAHSSSLSSVQFLLKARVQGGLNLIEEAVYSYGRALSMDPDRSEWRLEFSRFLFEADMLAEARKELLTILALNPHDGRAKELYFNVIRGLAIK